jgi:hypothetical protein
MKKSKIALGEGWGKWGALVFGLCTLVFVLGTWYFAFSEKQSTR